MNPKRSVLFATALCLLLVPTALGKTQDTPCVVSIDEDGKSLKVSNATILEEGCTLSPGSSKSGHILVKNNAERPFLASLSLAGVEEESPLGSLTISLRKRGDSSLPETSTTLSKAHYGMELGEVAPGGILEYDYALSMPSASGNDLTMKRASLEWTFSARETAKAPTYGESPFAKTGNSMASVLGLAAALLAGALMVAMAWAYLTFKSRRKKQ